MTWRRGRAYAQDLRDRVVGAVDGGMAAGAAASIFKVSVSYIYKALGRRRATGETAARPQRCHLEQKLAAHHEAIRAKVSAEPDATIDEVRSWLSETYGVSASQGLMWNTLRRLGLTLKKSRNTPPNKPAPTSRSRERLGASGSRGSTRRGWSSSTRLGRRPT